jgi:SWI/SNF-related matrix-associated actin-dependent regulator of chromatin subfamily A member 5
VYRLVTAGSVEERILQRAERKLLLDGAVARENSASGLDDAAAAFSSKELLADIKFGCQAIFGDGTKNELPSWEEIEQITDRSRTGTESMGKLKGDQTKSAATFDAQDALPDTQMFGGVDFRAIRRQQAKKERQIIPKTMSGIPRLWNDVKDLLHKRKLKSRVVMVETEFGGQVPVLTANNYDIAQGESSVFDRELKHQAKAKPSGAKASSGAKRDFEHQDVCQVCLVGRDLVLCKYCPVAVHSACAPGMESGTRFAHRCFHHSCGVCSKPASFAGGLLYACQGCENSWCEDCLPADDAGVRLQFLGDSHRFKELGFSPDSIAYIHCSIECEASATDAFGWTPEPSKPPCPDPLDLSSNFGFVPVDLSELDSESEEADLGARRPRKAAVAAAAAVTKLASVKYSDESPFSTRSAGGSSVFDPAAETVFHSDLDSSAGDGGSRFHSPGTMKA